MIRASIILAAVYCITRVLGRRSAAERHVIWTAAIISAALVPLLGLVLPAWHIEVAGRVAAVLPRISQTIQTQADSAGPGVTIEADGILPSTGMTHVLFIVWMLGTCVTFALLFTSSLSLSWLASRAKPITDAKWKDSATDLASRLRIGRTVRLLLSGRSTMPMTWGLFFPKLLLPVCATEWPEERQIVVLAHELAHVRRMDWMFQILTELTCAIYWFNPLFWIARNQLHMESERACDDAVLNLGIEGHDYATHLVDIARALKRQPMHWSLAMAMARHFSLERRLIAILDPTSNRSLVTRRAIWIVVLGTLCGVLPIAAVRAPLTAARIDTGSPTLTPNVPAISDSAPRLPLVTEYTTPPLYSDEARALGIQGVVRLELSVGVDGRARNLSVVKGLGSGLDENALLAVRQWRFSPGYQDGHRAEMTTQLDVEFDLRNAELNEQIANDMATRVGPGVVPPRIIHRVEPQYSTGPVTEEHSGSVVLDAVIQEDGIPKVVRVVRSLEWKLDDSAITALEQWRFSPAIKAGQPVKVRMNVEMSFSPKIVRSRQ